MSHEATARAYYRAIDAAAYDDLSALLAPAFVHDRPDRTLSGREEFVRFMREERPRTDTEHRIDGVYVDSGADDDGGGLVRGDRDGDGAATEVAVRGRLLDDEGGELFGFVDVFEFASPDSDAAVAHLTTYTD
ncbi:nuclear transport factor 2 family protein [Halobaculum roseum]|uniref:Nuclear transport factor 2 family protein n=1 Tax=Halobaculum roseum TaxID=2175149 RepID=A0ABD5MM28_9EURY|nr:nuclear transport factor 2 family protein [Halobaculum roseum]QZY04094.1 nuclear transport factor 2 family protein [Halobaculum roseum]